VEVVAVMPSRTTTSLVITVSKETQMVRMARMTRATTLALFQKTPKTMMVVINPAEEVVEAVEVVVSSPEGTAITIVVVTMVKTKRAVSLTMEEVATVNITTSTEEESRLQLKEITTRK
jgi:DTW domain-containing protein YfiP